MNERMNEELNMNTTRWKSRQLILSEGIMPSHILFLCKCHYTLLLVPLLIPLSYLSPSFTVAMQPLRNISWYWSSWWVPEARAHLLKPYDSVPFIFPNITSEKIIIKRLSSLLPSAPVPRETYLYRTKPWPPTHLYGINHSHNSKG